MKVFILLALVASIRAGLLDQQQSIIGNRDICVVDTDKVQTFDIKQLTIPPNDCEVVLIGDCNEQQQLHQRQPQQPWQRSQQQMHHQPLKTWQLRQRPQFPQGQFSQNRFFQGRYQQQGQQWSQQQIRVTLQSNTLQQFVESKVLKVTLEQTQVELEVTSGSSYGQTPIAVKVNGQQISVRGQQEIPIRSQQQQQLLAILKCTNDECEIESRKLDLHIKITEDKVHVQLKDAKSKGLCGLCLPGNEVATEVTNSGDFQTALKIFLQNIVPDQPECLVLGGSFQLQQLYNQQHRHPFLRRDMMGRGMDRNEAQRGNEDIFP